MKAALKWLERRVLTGSASGYFVRIGLAAGIVFTLRQNLAEFEIAPFPVTTTGLAFFATTVVAVWLGVEFFRLLSDDTGAESDLATAFIRHLDFLLREDKPEAVVRYHAALSRLLWVEGQLNARVEIGVRIAEAAAKISDTHTLAGVLIDDLGWTNVALGNHDEAITNIRRGIEIADAHSYHYWSAKGHRHLAGISVEQHEREAASQEFRFAREHARAIESPKTQLEMLGGIDYGEAVSAIRNGELDKALELVRSSEKHRKDVGDESRIVKVYALHGEILEKMGSRPQAKECYQLGLRAAKKIGRVDEEIRCLQGLARVEKDSAKRLELEQQASTLKSHTPIPYDTWR